jgi:Zn-dependent M16 (insulinase) family peptidase
VPAGNSFALARAAAGFSEALAIEDRWRGTSQVRFVKSLRAAEAIEEVAATLGQLRNAVFSREGLRLSLSADPENLDASKAALESALQMLPLRGSGTFPSAPAPASPARHEAYAISAQVGYAAVACRAARFGEVEFAHESILAHLLSRGALWDELRVRRGAYGASAYLESLEGVACFSTYRDPRPADSIGWFAEALSAASRGAGMETALESIVGTSGRDRKPLLPEERSSIDFRRELFGISDRLRQEKRDAMLATTEVHLRASAARLAASMASASSVLISNESDVQLSRRIRPDTLVAEAPL